MKTSIQTAILTAALWLTLASTALASAPPVAGAAKSAGRIFGFLVVIALVVGAIWLLMRVMRRKA